jgi:hypothetical protein
MPTDDDTTRDTVLAVIVSLAKLEHQRVKSARGTAQLVRGAHLGRPALAEAMRAPIAALADENPGMSNYAISEKLKLAPVRCANTVHPSDAITKRREATRYRTRCAPPVFMQVIGGANYSRRSLS